MRLRKGHKMPTSWPWIVLYVVGGGFVLSFVGAFLFQTAFLYGLYRLFKGGKR